jgi:hypothetical protein
VILTCTNCGAYIGMTTDAVVNPVYCVTCYWQAKDDVREAVLGTKEGER